MGGDLVSRALEMAREIRRGEAQHSPSALYGASCGRADVYRHAMLEAAYVVRSDTNHAPTVCEVCGYDFGADAPRTPVTSSELAIPLRLDDPSLTDAERRTIEWVLGLARGPEPREES